MQDQLPKTFFPFVWYFLKDFKGVALIFVALGICAGFYGPLSSMLTKYIAKAS